MKRNILFIVFILCALAGLQAQGYKVGDSATDFKLKNVDNKYVSLSDFSNAKGFIIVFTCNHCPYAKAYEERLVALDKKYKTKGYPVIAINPNDPVAVPADGFERCKSVPKKPALLSHIYLTRDRKYTHFMERHAHLTFMSFKKQQKATLLNT